MGKNIKTDLQWLFQNNADKKDFIRYIFDRGGNWARSISSLIKNLREKGALGIHDKFSDLGFNANNAYVQLKARFTELEVGNFILSQGENVKFLEGHYSPDMISGKDVFDKVWEISSIFDSPELKDLWIEANRIIKNWNRNIKCNIRLSLNLSSFQPTNLHHQNFQSIVEDSLNQLKQFDSSKIQTDQGFVLRTPMIHYEFKLSNDSFSGIVTLLEGGIEGMAFLESQDYIDDWVRQFKDRIKEKANQLIDDINEIESEGTNKWDDSKYRIIALTSDADVFYDQYYIPTLFGSQDIHSDDYINDPHLINVDPSNP